LFLFTAGLIASVGLIEFAARIWLQNKHQRIIKEIERAEEEMKRWERSRQDER